MGLDELRELIAQVARDGSTKLDLRQKEISELPPEISQLHHLKSLDLGRNWLTTIPPEIFQLHNLQSLEIGDNLLTTVPPEIGQLHNLQSLDLGRNWLTAIPPEISQLQNLQLLDLGSNKLTTVPPEIGQLQNLYLLNLGDNQLFVIPPEISQLYNLRELGLWANNLKTVPPEIGQLQNLQSLYLMENHLVVVPPEIGRLYRLQTLDLRDNQLTAVPPKIGELQNLQWLELWGNQLTTIPSQIGQLHQLQSLDLGQNLLTTIPIEISNLHHLQSLDLRYNRLTTLPAEISQLGELQVLDLEYNQLTAVPDEIGQLNNLQFIDIRNNRIRELPESLIHLPRLIKLLVEGNPITSPSPEVLGGALTDMDKWVDLDALRRYYTQLKKEGEAYFYEAKLLIIGEGGAGKTSLARKLQDPTASLPKKEDSTEGVDIVTWHFPLPHTPSEQYRVNIWDFGGQEIYHTTHQFFLTRSSIYVLVADTRQQHTDFYTWLLMQEAFGGNSPVILLKNQNREKGNKFTIENLPQLRERFPNLKEIIELDLNEAPNGGIWSKLLSELRHRLIGLDHIGEPRPRTWVAVRRALQNNPNDTITEAEYFNICAQHGISDRLDSAQLSEYLHQVGDILHFQEDPVLADIIILKPTWGLDAVYRILNNPIVERRHGRFTLAELRTLWHEDKYSGHHHQLLRLMQKFQICYPLPDQPDSYIAPQLLPVDPPSYTWDETANLQLRYRYPIFMPRGILSRVIVKLHQYIERNALVWGAGVIFQDGPTRAEVLEFRGEKEIRIRVAGQYKRDLLMEIIRVMDDLHRGFPKLRYEKHIPCNCPNCVSSHTPHFFDLEKLRQRLSWGKRTIECERPPYPEVSVRGLLDDTMASGEAFDRQRMLIILDTHYNDEELRTLCFELEVDYDNLGARSKEGKARELIQYLKRHNQLHELIAHIR